MSGSELPLYQEITLLALRDEAGTVEFGASFSLAVAGALLADLLLHRRITVEATDKRKLASVADEKPLEDALLEECRQKVLAARRRASLMTWVQRFSSIKQLKHRAAGELCRRGILRADEDKVLLIFRRRIYPEADPAPEKAIRDRLDHAVFAEDPKLDARTVVLVSLAQQTGLLGIVLGKKRVKGRKARVEQIVRGELVGQATKEAIQAVQTAIMVACIVPSIVAATAAHH